MKNILLLFTLLSFACYGQRIAGYAERRLVSKYENPCLNCAEMRMVLVPENTALGQYTTHMIDTPQTDSNPHDFYGDTNIFIGNYIQPDTSVKYTIKYNLTKEQMDSVNRGEIILMYRPRLSPRRKQK